MEQHALKGFEGCEKDTPKAPELPEFKYLEVEVTREQCTTVYLKVPQNFDIKSLRRDHKHLSKACKETTSESDWNDFGWELDVSCNSIKEVSEKEATMYEVYEVKL